MNMRIFSISAALGVVLCTANSRGEETVVNVGDSFTCYFQNAGDNRYSGDSDYPYASASDWSDEAKACVQRALQMWDDVITSDASRRVRVGVYWVDFSVEKLNSGLAACNPMLQLSTNPTSTVYKSSTYAESLWRDGVDITPWSFSKSDYTTFDITVYVNTQYAQMFYYGTDLTTTLYDFQSVIAHEIGHNLGFASLAKDNGAFIQMIGTTYYTTFDSLMVGADGKSLLEELQADPTASVFTLGETISLEGSELTAYNPMWWADASSMTHVNGGENLMYYSMTPGQVKRELSDAEVELMGLMGWSVIPEPSTVTLTLFGLTGLLFRRKRG